MIALLKVLLLVALSGHTALYIANGLNVPPGMEAARLIIAASGWGVAMVVGGICLFVSKP